MADKPSIGILGRRREPKKDGAPARSEGDLGRLPTVTELMTMELNPEDVVADHDADLEGHFANTAVVVRGRRVRLSQIRTQEHAGLLLAEATSEQIEAEAHYRAWRARLGLQVVTKAAKELPEWRVRQIVEAEPNYLTYQTANAKAAGHVLALRAVWETWGDD